MSFEEIIKKYKQIWWKNFLYAVKILEMVDIANGFVDETVKPRMDFLFYMDKELVYNKSYLRDDFWKKKIKTFKIEEENNG